MTDPSLVEVPSDNSESVLTYLDPPETNPPSAFPALETAIPETPSPDVAFRHSGWVVDRARVDAALMQAGIPQSRLTAFRECGSRAWIWKDALNPGIFRITSSHCHDRWCVPCAVERSRRIARSLALLMEGETCRLLTLTVRSSDQPLTVLLDHLYTSFSVLRRRKQWKNNVLGGAAFCELTLGSDSKTWHPHLHIVYTGSYLPLPWLKSAWLDITKDSFICDIRKIPDHRKAVAYVSKYASKPMTRELLASPDHLVEAIGALAGRRLCTTFGTWRKVNLSSEPDIDLMLDHVWIPLGSLNVLIEKAQSGDPDATSFLTCLLEFFSCTNKNHPPPVQRSTDRLLSA